MWKTAVDEAGKGEWIGWVFGAGVLTVVLLVMARSVKQKKRRR